MSGFSVRLFFSLLLVIGISFSASGQPVLEKTWAEGVAYIQEGDYLRGLEKMNVYLEYAPQNEKALNNRAICLYHLGDRRACCRDLKSAIAMGLKKNSKMYNYFCDRDYQLKFLQKQFYKGLHLDPENGLRPVYTKGDTLRGALRPERTCFDVYFYNLTVKIHPRKKTIRGSNEIWFEGVHASRQIQIDLFDEFKVHSIQMDSTELTFRREYQALFIDLPTDIQPGGKYKISIEYEGKPMVADDPPWDGGFVWKRDKRGNRWAGVACEQLGASSWWPNKDHLTDRPDSMAINIEVPKRFQAVCNGRIRNVVETESNFIRYEWFVSYPINNYNVTFYMGKYAEFTDTLTCEENELIARYHVMPYNLEKAKAHFKQARDVVSYYNEAFGPFPFREDDFRMVESPYEGMEHQTAIAYGSAYNDKKHSDTYVTNDFDYIIVHEAAHEWWGNSVAAGDMADVWLHEGFATYAEFMFIEHMLGYEASMEEINTQNGYIFNIWPLVQNRDVNEDAFAGNDVYTKGAALLQCLRATMDNDSRFKNMLRDFHLAYRDSIIDSDDFIHYVHACSGEDYTALFNKYLYETGLPVLRYSYEREEGDIVLRYKWTETEPGFKMPFSVKTIENNEDIRITATTTEQEVVLENTESFWFYQPSMPTTGCPRNGLTYFWTLNRNNE